MASAKSLFDKNYLTMKTILCVKNAIDAEICRKSGLARHLLDCSLTSCFAKNFVRFSRIFRQGHLVRA